MDKDKREELRKSFKEALKNTEGYDYYSYWPGDDTRKGLHAFRPDGKYCKECGEEKDTGVHIKIDGKVVTYP
jgi:hypothetical protein